MTDEELHSELSRLIFESLGEASMCWKHIKHAGVFQSSEAKRIGETLVQKVERLYGENKETCTT